MIFIFPFMLLGLCPFELANQNKYKQTNKQELTTVRCLAMAREDRSGRERDGSWRRSVEATCAMTMMNPVVSCCESRRQVKVAAMMKRTMTMMTMMVQMVWRTVAVRNQVKAEAVRRRRIHRQLNCICCLTPCVVKVMMILGSVLFVLQVVSSS